jgi:anti-anti-sigma factor
MQHRPCGGAFEIRQRDDPDGALRVTLIGEIDVAVADELKTHLRRLQGSPWPVRLDLSQPRFIDCGGIGAILDALEDARRAGGQLDVDRRVSQSVARIVALLGIASDLWPDARQTATTENTGGSRVATPVHVAPASPEPNTSPEVAPK